METYDFKKYQAWIKKQAWKISKKYSLDYQDVESQGYLIYVETIKKHIPEKGSFFTFLYHRMQHLNTYGKKQCSLRLKLLWVENFDFLITYDEFISRLELYDTIATELSSNAQLILKYLFSSGKKKYSRTAVKHYFKENYQWKPKKFNSVWEELTVWWDIFAHSKIKNYGV